MSVDESALKAEYSGITYYFCCQHCKESFLKNPEKFLKKEKIQEEKHTTGTIYTCPMHPEVKSEKHGSCPECGMALESMLPALQKTEWTCPMHPEIIQDKPGNCPICGMALEQKIVPLEEENPELIDMWHRLKYGAILTIPLLVIAMGEMLPGLKELLHKVPMRILQYVELILATPVVLFGGMPFFSRFYQCK